MQRLSSKRKIEIVEEYINTNRSLEEVSIRNNICFDTLKLWVKFYKMHGREVFNTKKKRVFSNNFKVSVCEEYMKTGVSLNKISIKYAIDPSTIRKWLKKYEILKSTLNN